MGHSQASPWHPGVLFLRVLRCFLSFLACTPPVRFGKKIRRLCSLQKAFGGSKGRRSGTTRQVFFGHSFVKTLFFDAHGKPQFLTHSIAFWLGFELPGPPARLQTNIINSFRRSSFGGRGTKKRPGTFFLPFFRLLDRRWALQGSQGWLAGIPRKLILATVL